MLRVLLLSIVLSGALGHDEYLGKCPEFSPMPGFDWNEFMEGRWYAMEKFDTTQSKCFTYDFGEDEDGFKYVEQNSILKGLKRFSVDNKYRYKGRISSPSRANPASMIVRFPLNVLGSSSFVVMDTDYDNYALLCTCQAKSILSLITFHRRSCTILQREPIWSSEISKKMHDFLNEKVKTSDSELPDHDFDRVDHSNCNYADDGKGVQIDVDKILGIGGQFNPTLTKAVDDLAGGLFGEAEVDDREETASNLPLKASNPRI